MSAKQFGLKLFPRTEKLNSQGQVPIYARIRTDKKIEISTTITIDPNDWNEKTQRVNASAKDGNQKNVFLDSFQSKVLEAYSKLFVNGEPLTIDKLRDHIFGKVEREKTLLDVVIEHNENFEKRIGKDYSYGSFKNYKTTKNYLTEFIRKTYKANDLAISQVKYSFCQKYYIFLTTVKPCNTNGANKHIQRVKKIINYAYKMGYIRSNTLASYSLKFLPFNREKLTWNEVLVLQSLKPVHSTVQNVLNVFLFQCFTGLSYSDVKKFCLGNIVIGIDGKSWINMTRTKTKRIFTVPLLKPALEIIKLYPIETVSFSQPIFPVLSNQKMNDYLKVIGTIAGLTINLSSHVARHVFATTITLQEGVPLETVSRMLGHSNVRTTQIYATVTELKISRDMQAVQEKHSS